jgi:hypothetical protein
MTEPVETPKVEEPKVETPPAPAPATPPEDDFDKDRALATIKAQREAEKALKDELKEANKAKAELQAIKDAEKSELEREREAREKLENENPKLKEELRDARLTAALADPSLGVVEPETAANMLKQRGLTFGDDGKPENLAEAVEKLLEAKPFLKGGPAEPPKPAVPNIDAGAGQGNGPAPNLTAEELDAAKELGQDPILFAELKRARKENGGMMTYEQYQAAVERANAAKT